MVTENSYNFSKLDTMIFVIYDYQKNKCLPFVKGSNIEMTHIYPIAGGKGGIGKSFIAANLGVLLAKQGKKVVLVDLDLGGSNLHTFIGLNKIKTGIHKFLNKSAESLDHVAVPSEIPGLHLVSSMDCTVEIANLFAAQKLKIIKSLQKLPFDYVLLDLGAGTNFNTLDFFLTSNNGIFICTPEPTSIENAFKFIKAVYLRMIKQILKQTEFKEINKKVAALTDDSDFRSSKIIETIMQHDPQKGEILQKKLGDFKFKFIINQFRKTSDSSLGAKIEKVCNRHFFSEFMFLGNICYDERVHDSIFTKKIYVNKYSYTVSAIDLNNVAKNLTGNKKKIESKVIHAI